MAQGLFYHARNPQRSDLAVSEIHVKGLPLLLVEFED
jgi:hypothetical protein